jgi:hypothetical protein
MGPPLLGKFELGQCVSALLNGLGANQKYEGVGSPYYFALYLIIKGMAGGKTNSIQKDVKSHVA